MAMFALFSIMYEFALPITYLGLMLAPFAFGKFLFRAPPEERCVIVTYHIVPIQEKYSTRQVYRVSMISDHAALPEIEHDVFARTVELDENSENMFGIVDYLEAQRVAAGARGTVFMVSADSRVCARLLRRILRSYVSWDPRMFQFAGLSELESYLGRGQKEYTVRELMDKYGMLDNYKIMPRVMTYQQMMHAMFSRHKTRKNKATLMKAILAGFPAITI